MTQSKNLKRYTASKWILVLAIAAVLIFLIRQNWVMMVVCALGALYMLKTKNKYKQLLEQDEEYKRNTV